MIRHELFRHRKVTVKKSSVNVLGPILAVVGVALLVRTARAGRTG